LKKTFWINFVIALSVAFCFSTVAAQDNAPGALLKKDSPIVTEDVNPRLKIPISMRAQDASLSEILKILADRSGMNFVTGEGVYKEKITIILTRTAVDEAIDLVVRAAGLSYEIIGNSVLIAESDKLKGEVGQQGYVIELKYANAEEVAAMLGDLTKYVKVDKGGNRLVCFTSPRVINEIVRIVKSIDHPHILVLLDTRIVEVSMDKLKNYGLNWATLLPISGGIGHGAVSLATGYTKDGWILNPLAFDTKLDMMVENNDASILMNSKITTTNNREASLHIGDVIPYTIQSYNMAGNGGGGANQQIQKENVGVLLTMTPHVNEDNQVTLQLEPEVSNIVAFIGPNKDMPQTRVRKVSTTVRVRDGQTVFLAGLLDEEKSMVVDKIPILGDIPLLGAIFRHKSEHLTKKNLVIEVTPRIIRDSTSIESRGGNGSGASRGALPEGSTGQTAPQPAGAQTPIDIAPAPAKP
jgi:type II secretory pathway component GspD/PulD (secretin)